MNKADQDCGTTFSWVTRAMGPYAGWMGGWAICTTGILVVGSLADVAARYFYILVGIDASKLVVTVTAVAIIGAMTYVCVVGTDISARAAERADPRPGRRADPVRRRGAGQGARRRRAGRRARRSRSSWLNPFEIDSMSALIAGLLTGVFIYWGWESAVNLTEEVEDSETAPGKAAVVSTVILLVTYVGVGDRGRRVRRRQTRSPQFEDDDAILSILATERARQPAGPARGARGADLGARLDADDDPARLADDAVDGALGRDAASGSRTSTRAS